MAYRRGSDETTTLVRTGVFGWVRNPIFTAMITFGFGIALVTPNLVAIAGFLLLVATIELQVRIVEEPYLTAKHGDSYRDYLAQVADSCRVLAWSTRYPSSPPVADRGLLGPQRLLEYAPLPNSPSAR